MTQSVRIKLLLCTFLESYVNNHQLNMIFVSSNSKEKRDQTFTFCTRGAECRPRVCYIVKRCYGTRDVRWAYVYTVCVTATRVNICIAFNV